MWRLFVLSCVVPWTAVVAQGQSVVLSTLTAEDGEGLQHMGWSAALSGDRALVGAPFDDLQGPAAGAAHLYERDATGAWQHVALLRSSSAHERYYFGNAVALDGDRALVGAPGDAWPAPRSGSVTVFERDATGVWSEVLELTSFRRGEAFGTAVALRGDRAVIGAPYPDDLPGLVFVFERDALGQWWQTAMLSADDASTWNAFGAAVAFEGDRVLVGAKDDDDLAFSAGSAYVFEREPSGAWVQRAKLVASDGASQDRFGIAVVLAGERAYVGSALANGASADAGAVYVFERTPAGEWLETGKIVASDGEYNDQFGASLALSGRRLLVGAQLDNHGEPFGSGHNAGSAYLFERADGGGWTEVERITADAPQYADEFASAVALQDDLALIGSTRDDELATNSGSAHLFDVEPLSVDVRELSLATGGVQALALEAGLAHAGLEYRLLGSLIGTEPGIVLSGGLLLPLVPDAYFVQTLREPNRPPLAGSLGLLDANGGAQATFTLPAGLPIALVGRTVHHAFVAFVPGERRVRFASNAQPILLVP